MTRPLFDTEVVEIALDRFISLMPDDLAERVSLAREWEKINLPQGPDVVEIGSIVLDDWSTVEQNALTITREFS